MQGENDPLEPTARPREYMVYTRIGYGGFDNGVRVNKPSYTLKIEPGLVYSFKVTAVNHGAKVFHPKSYLPIKPNKNMHESDHQWF